MRQKTRLVTQSSRLAFIVSIPAPHLAPSCARPARVKERPALDRAVLGEGQSCPRWRTLREILRRTRRLVGFTC